MPLFLSAIVLIVVSNVAYHVSQKSIPATLNPVLSLLVTYFVAIGITLCLYPLFPARPASAPLSRQIHWSSVVIGVAIVGVELGYLLAYRAGWRVTVGSAAANAAVALLLIPVGLLFFGERLSLGNAIGVILCLAGLILVIQR